MVIFTYNLKQLIMSKSLGKKDFSKVGLLAIVFVNELNRKHGILPSNSRKSLEKAMTSDLLKLSRKEIETMATIAKGQHSNWGSFACFSSTSVNERDLFKNPFYKSRTSDLILSDRELIQEVEANNNLSSFYLIGLYETKEDAVKRSGEIKWQPSEICVLDFSHIKYLASHRVS
jgi:hypothetical protein